MELLASPEAQLIARDIGVFAIAHLGIILNRNYIRPKLNNKLYNTVSLYTEHFISYLTMAMFSRSIGILLGELILAPNGVPKEYLNIPIKMTESGVPIMRAIGGDLISAKMQWGKPQWDQFAVDLAGWGTYMQFLR